MVLIWLGICSFSIGNIHFSVFALETPYSKFPFHTAVRPGKFYGDAFAQTHGQRLSSMRTTKTTMTTGPVSYLRCLVAVALLWTCRPAPLQNGLTCVQQNGSGHGDDDDNGATVQCTFTLPSNVATTHHLEHCESDGTVCVSVSATIQPPLNSNDDRNNRQPTSSDLHPSLHPNDLQDLEYEYYTNALSLYPSLDEIRTLFESMPAKTYDFAYGNWLLQLGMALRIMTVNHDDNNNNNNNNNRMGNTRLSYTTNDDDTSLHEAVRVYEQALIVHRGLVLMANEPHHHDSTHVRRTEANVGMALSLAYLAGTQLMLPDIDIDAIQEKFDESERIYRQALQDDPNPDIDLDANEHAEFRMNWADVLVRLATLLLDHPPDVPADNVQYILEVDAKDLTKAQGLLDEALSLYRRPGQLNDRMQEVVRLARIGDAIQTLASVYILRGMERKWLEKAVETHMEAIDVYDLAFHLNGRDHPHEGENLRIGYAESTYSVADIHMQLGAYSAAKAMYRTSMEWHRDENTGVPTMMFSPQDEADIEAEIASHEEELRQYMDGAYGGYEVDVSGHYDKETVAQDELYEAQILATLGALTLSLNENEMALEHFSRAIDIYEKYPGEDERRAVGDLKLNVASALYRNKDFVNSANAYDEAMDRYQESFGDGVNPLTGSTDAMGNMMYDGYGARADYQGGINNDHPDGEQHQQDPDQPPLINLDTILHMNNKNGTNAEMAI